MGLTRALNLAINVEVLSPVQLPGNPLDPEDALQWGLSLAPGSGTVIHAHNYEVALPALVAKALTGAPLVVTLHLPAPPRYRSLERQLLEAADAVIAVSDSLAAEYRERGWRMPAPTVIPNGINPNFHCPDPGKPREPGRLLFAGRLDPQKGCDLAIRALRELLPAFPSLRLHVAGAGPWEQGYRNLARRLGLGEQVRWLGWLSPIALRAEYRRCGVFLMPSRREPFGLSALEAMACGAPVVAARVGGLPEFISPDENGLLLPAADPSALAQALRPLLVNSAQAARLGSAAAARAPELTWAHVAEQTVHVYRSLPPASFGSPVDPGQQWCVAWEVLRSLPVVELAGP